MEILSILLMFLFAQNFQFVRQAEADLNGDGTSESITLTSTDELGNFTLKVGNFELKGNLGDTVDGFVIVDVDSSDPYREIGIHTPGPSDDDVFLMIWFNGREIRTMGILSRWPSFQGNGIVYVDDWMGFWIKREKYVLNKNSRLLDRVPQELYYVGVEATVKKSFPIYRSRNGLQSIANLREGSKILIFACDPQDTNYLNHWYLVKSESGLLGWAKLGNFMEKVQGLPWAD